MSFQFTNWEGNNIHSRNVCLLLFDENGSFLLQHRDQNASTLPGQWGFFGGAVEQQETMLDGMRREAWEELRYRPKKEKPVLKLIIEDPNTGAIFLKWYFLELCSEKTALELHEGDGMEWFTPAETESIALLPRNRKILYALEDYRNKPSFLPSLPPQNIDPAIIRLEWGPL